MGLLSNSHALAPSHNTFHGTSVPVQGACPGRGVPREPNFEGQSDLIVGQGESETPLLEGKHKFLRGDPGEEKGVTLKDTRPDMHACMHAKVLRHVQLFVTL